MDKLLEFRLSKGLNKIEMAKKIGVSRSYYEKIEFSKRNLTVNFLRKLKKAFPEFDILIFFEEE